MNGMKMRVKVFDGLKLIESLILPSGEAWEMVRSMRRNGYRVIPGIA
jgi:glutamine amidotransferase PdxT